MAFTISNYTSYRLSDNCNWFHFWSDGKGRYFRDSISGNVRNMAADLFTVISQSKVSKSKSIRGRCFREFSVNFPSIG